MGDLHQYLLIFALLHAHDNHLFFFLRHLGAHYFESPIFVQNLINAPNLNVSNFWKKLWVQIPNVTCEHFMAKVISSNLKVSIFWQKFKF